MVVLEGRDRCGIAAGCEPVVEDRAHTVAAAVDELSDYLIGKDPMPIEDHWNVLYEALLTVRGGPHERHRGHRPGALGHQGKALGVPVHELFWAGRARQIRVYSWDGARPAIRARRARDGGTWLHGRQMNASEELQSSIPCQDRRGRRARGAVREAVGPHSIASICTGGCIGPMAKVLLRVGPFKLMIHRERYFSEALRGVEGNRPALLHSYRLGGAFLALGLQAILTEGCVDIIQPDPSHAGGHHRERARSPPWRMLRRSLGAALPAGAGRPGANLQLDAVCYNAFIRSKAWPFIKPRRRPVSTT